VQVEAAKARREAAAREEMEYARQAVNVKKAMDEMEAKRRAFMAGQSRDLATFLSTQRDAADQRTRALNDTYRGEVRPDFFAQFGTSHR